MNLTNEGFPAFLMFKEADGILTESSSHFGTTLTFLCSQQLGERSKRVMGESYCALPVQGQQVMTLVFFHLILKRAKNKISTLVKRWNTSKGHIHIRSHAIIPTTQVR